MRTRAATEVAAGVRETRPSFAGALGRIIADEMRPEISGLGVGETRASRVSSAIMMVGSAVRPIGSK